MGYKKAYRGIDISLYQGEPDFRAVKNAGMDFVILKASQGRTAEYNAPFEVPNFRTIIQRLSSQGGLYAGAYHYFCARNENEADEEADFFIKLVSEYRFDLQLWAALDVEDSGFLPSDKAKLTALVARFCGKVKAAGLRPMVYANSWWLDSRFDSPAGVPVWEANWSSGKLPERCRMWQYSSTGRVGGINGNVDMNVAFDIIGDANSDGSVDMKDVIRVIRSVSGWDVKIDESQADVNSDGYVNMKDIIQTIRTLGEDGK